MRNEARQMLATALQAEVIAYVEAFVDEVDEHGRRLVVRNGYHPATGERQRFSSAILPAWARKSPREAEVLPLLYLHGLSSDLGPARSSRTASSSHDPTNQQAVTPTRMTR